MKRPCTTEQKRVQARVSGDKIPYCIFQEFAQRNIAYCHWESNAELREGLLGLKDLDVLVEKGSPFFDSTLEQSGFKRFLAVSTNGFPGVEDFLGFDHETGKLYHLHLHHQIVVGEKHLRSYRLPWEQKVLSTRVLEQEEQVYITNPNIEILLLLVSYCFEIENKGSNCSFVPKAIFQ